MGDALGPNTGLRITRGPVCLYDIPVVGYCIPITEQPNLSATQYYNSITINLNLKVVPLLFDLEKQPYRFECTEYTMKWLSLNECTVCNRMISIDWVGLIIN